MEHWELERFNSYEEIPRGLKAHITRDALYFGLDPDKVKRKIAKRLEKNFTKKLLGEYVA